MNRLLKDTLKIFLITLISGLLLGGVYIITKEPIEKTNYEAKIKSYKEVFATADDFKNIDFDENASKEILANNNLENETINEVLEAYSNNELCGYVFTATSNEGYGGDITISVGISLDGTVNAYSILKIEETAGLGMKAKEAAFKNQFNNKNVGAFVVTKTGKTSDSEIDAISGATRTSNAITHAVNSCIVYFNSLVNNEGGATNE